jgi:hypothetical protein
MLNKLLLVGFLLFVLITSVAYGQDEMKYYHKIWDRLFLKKLTV